MSDIAPRSPSSPRAAGDLKPLDLALSPEVQMWVQELRTLWEAVGMSVNRFARLNYINKGTVSRYLNGERVPGDHWFLNRLLAIQAEKGREVSQQVREHLTRLQLEALQVAHPHEYRVRLVRDDLQVAVVGQREAERYATHLEHQLAERIRQLDELTDQHGRLIAAWDADRTAMQADKDRLDAGIADLAHRLEHARQRAADAEQRCQELERLLDHLEEPSLANPADSFPGVYFSSPRAAATLLEAMGKVEAWEQVHALADQAAADCPLTNPDEVGLLLAAMRTAGTWEQARVLANRAAADYSLADPGEVGALLEAMRMAGREDQARALARRAAIGCPLIHDVAFLLAAMGDVGAGEQARVLANRAAIGCSLTNPGEVVSLLEAMQEMEEQARALANRAAISCPLTEPEDAALLLVVMGKVGAWEQARVFANRAAIDCPLSNPEAVAFLAAALRKVGAEEQARALAERVSPG